MEVQRLIQWSMPTTPHGELCLSPNSVPLYFEVLKDLDAHRVNKEYSHKPSSVNSNHDKPQLLVCHDFQGGYTENPHQKGYTFEHWAYVNAFVYFSHKRVSIPPPGWIRASRRHGVAILGTLIFEWTESKADLKALLDGPSPHWDSIVRAKLSKHYAIELVHLALAHGVDGFLVNVETSMQLRQTNNEILARLDSQHNTERLRKWVGLLRDEGRKLKPDWQVVWYDSVVYPNGELAWQDALTPSNVPFAKVATSVFTNYTWAHPKRCNFEESFHPLLSLSAAIADSIRMQRSRVFVGIDVFGRNCFGGNETYKALDLIAPHIPRGEPTPSDLAEQGDSLGLSVALFAPGWTWEHNPPPSRSWEAWWNEDCSFWIQSPRAIRHYFSSHAFPWQGTNIKGFRTNFSLGSGTQWFVQGKNVYQDTEKGWTDMGVCAPKPVLAWPETAYVLDAQGDHSDQKVTTKLRPDLAWSGCACLSIDSLQSMYVPLFSLAPFPYEAKSVVVQIWAKGDCTPCLRINEQILEGPLSQGNDGGWAHITSKIPMSEWSGAEVHLMVKVQGAVFVGQVDIVLGEYPDTDGVATWEGGLLKWSDFVPWCAYYEIFSLDEETTRIGTVTHDLDRTQTILPIVDENQVVQIRSSGAGSMETGAFVMPA